MTLPTKKNNWKPFALVFLAVLIGFVVSQWLWSRSAESSSWEECTSWQKYRTRNRLGLEGPLSPESMLITDMLQSCKLLESSECADDGKPVE